MVPYAIVTFSLAGPVPAAPPLTWSQTSNDWVVALLKFFTAAQSTTIHVVEPSVRVPMRIAPPAPGLRSVQKGATTLFGRAVFGNACGNGVASAPEPPPITRVPF